jgi:hypothetical protein
MGRMGRFKYHDLEVTFQQELAQAEDLVKKLPPPPPPSAGKDSIVLELSTGQEQPFVRPLSSFHAHGKDLRTLSQQAENSPRLAIESAWGLVVRALGRGDRRPLPDAESRLLGLLQALRDRASRLDCDAPTTDQARRFIDLACPLASRIEARG